MKRLRVNATARRNLDDISAHIELWSADDRVADGVISRLLEQCEKLAALSGTLGRPRPEIGADVRSFPFAGYLIFFRYKDDELVVLNVLSGRRDIDGFFDEAE